MDNNLIAYRRKHKRCRYCKYNGYIGGGGHRIFNWCHAKQKKKQIDCLLYLFIISKDDFVAYMN